MLGVERLRKALRLRLIVICRFSKPYNETDWLGGDA